MCKICDDGIPPILCRACNPHLTMGDEENRRFYDDLRKRNERARGIENLQRDLRRTEEKVARATARGFEPDSVAAKIAAGLQRKAARLRLQLEQQEAA